MLRKLARIVGKGSANQGAKRKFDPLDLSVQFPKRWRKIEALLHEEVLDGRAKRALALGDEGLEVSVLEWVAEENVECQRYPIQR